MVGESEDRFFVESVGFDFLIDGVQVDEAAENRSEALLFSVREGDGDGC